MNARIWLTGFEPFGEHTTNPSQELVEQYLNSTCIHSPRGVESGPVEMTFLGRILSVDEVGSCLSLAHLDGVDAIIHVGLNERAEKVRLEMCAANLCDFRIPDNSGRQLQDVLISSSGPNLLQTTTPRAALTAALLGNQFVETSEDCGHFVCNETYYRTLHAIRQQSLDSEKKATPAIFVHIPSFEYVSMEDQSEILIELCAQIVQRI